MRTNQKFTTIRKPIYICEVTANSDDFTFAYELHDEFVKKHPEYAECKYDSDYKCGMVTILYYRECAIDFI